MMYRSQFGAVCGADPVRNLLAVWRCHCGAGGRSAVPCAVLCWSLIDFKSQCLA